MTRAAVALDLDKAFDVERGVTAQVALNGEVFINVVTDKRFFVLGQVLHSGIGIDLRGGEDLVRSTAANAVDISEANFDSLFLGQVNSGDTCHGFSTS